MHISALLLDFVGREIIEIDAPLIVRPFTDQSFCQVVLSYLGYHSIIKCITNFYFSSCLPGTLYYICRAIKWSFGSVTCVHILSVTNKVWIRMGGLKWCKFTYWAELGLLADDCDDEMVKGIVWWRYDTITQSRLVSVGQSIIKSMMSTSELEAARYWTDVIWWEKNLDGREEER